MEGDRSCGREEISAEDAGRPAVRGMNPPRQSGDGLGRMKLGTSRADLEPSDRERAPAEALSAQALYFLAASQPSRTCFLA
jgi:hypothetical protein